MTLTSNQKIGLKVGISAALLLVALVTIICYWPWGGKEVASPAKPTITMERAEQLFKARLENLAEEKAQGDSNKIQDAAEARLAEEERARDLAMRGSGLVRAGSELRPTPGPEAAAPTPVALLAHAPNNRTGNGMGFAFTADDRSGIGSVTVSINDGTVRKTYDAKLANDLRAEIRDLERQLDNRRRGLKTCERVAEETSDRHIRGQAESDARSNRERIAQLERRLSQKKAELERVSP